MTTPYIAAARVAGLALLGGVIIGGCAAPDVATMTAPQGSRHSQVGGMYDPEAGLVSAGIYSGPSGTYTVRTSVVGGGDYAFTGDRDLTFATPVDVVNGRSGYVYLQAHRPTWLTAPTATVTVSEVGLPAGTQADSIKVLYNGVMRPVVTGQSSVSLTVGYLDVAAVSFFNSVSITPQPSLPATGCTPDYWREPKHFDSWPASITPRQLVSSRFPSASLYTTKHANIGHLPLEDALSLHGKGKSRAAQKLLRSGVAALLNSRSTLLTYPMTETAVVQAVEAALQGGNRGQMLTLGHQLTQYNHAHCPLN